MKDIGWARLLAMLIFGSIGTWFAFALTVSGVTRAQNPQVALRFVRSESSALATRSAQLLQADPMAPPEEVKRLALAALRQQAVNASALRTLGFYFAAKGDAAAADALVRQAEKVSRREIGAQLWLIQMSVEKGDVAGALAHYDIALRTTPSFYTLLYPQLVTALQDRGIRQAMKPYIRAPQGWGDSFLAYADAHSTNLPALVALIREGGGLSDPKKSYGQIRELISRLVRERYFSEARELFVGNLRGEASRLTSLTFDRTDVDAQYGAMGWQIAQTSSAGGSFSGSDRGALSLSIFANASATQTVASKLLFLPPGPYRFSARLQQTTMADGAFVRWQLRCGSAQGGTPLWVLDDKDAVTNATFIVPANCPVQFFDIVASGGQGQVGMEAVVTGVAIERSRSSQAIRPGREPGEPVA